jgi:hypothetical protein
MSGKNFHLNLFPNLIIIIGGALVPQLSLFHLISLHSRLLVDCPVNAFPTKKIHFVANGEVVEGGVGGRKERTRKCVDDHQQTVGI